MYDAKWYEIKELQKKLARHGISKEQLDLDQYAGLTPRELEGILEFAIARRKKKEVTMMEEPRALTLLKATREFLTKVRVGGNSDAMCVTAHYDDADCDGYCLLDDIDAYLEEYNGSQTEQENGSEEV